jgi:hypothetical protein
MGRQLKSTDVTVPLWLSCHICLPEKWLFIALWLVAKWEKCGNDFQILRAMSLHLIQV